MFTGLPATSHIQAATNIHNRLTTTDKPINNTQLAIITI